MRRQAAFALGITLAVLSAHAARAQTQDQVWQQIKSLNWQFNGRGGIGSEAAINIPSGYAFLNASDARRFLELQGNLAADNEYVIGPKDLRWFAVFRFESIGYVRDDEHLDPDQLLDTLKANNRAGLEERKRRGLPPLYLVGWYVQPHYDLQTKRLEWGTKLTDDSNSVTVNYTIKLLGREGVMDAVLVSEPTSLDADTRDFKALLSNYSFNPGSRYFEFQNGDKVAAYGLSALIVGGAAAATVKSGALKGLIKFVWIGAVAAFAGIVGFFKRLFGSGKQRA